MTHIPSKLSFSSVAAALFGGLLLTSPALAQERVVPHSKEQVQFSFAPIVKQVSSSVVNVYGTRVERTRTAPEDEFFYRFFGNSGRGLPRERVQRSLGSGVIVDSDGLVVTNNHVIENMTAVRVALSDRREFDADIILRDPRTDLAVLKLKGAKDLKPLPFGDSESLEVGDIVLAIGNPFGVGQTVTQGIVSALARTQVGVSDYQFFIQTDAAINPGNSGGGLINMKGEMVGINTAIYSRSGGSIGIGFSIPSAMVRAVVQTARKGGSEVARPWFGAKLQAVSADVAEAMGLERPTGALIVNLAEGGPAEKAGLQRGDIIVAVDNRLVDDMEAFGYRFALKGVEGEAKLTIVRRKERLEKIVKLMAPPEIPPLEAIELRGRSPFTGATIGNLSPAIAEKFDLDTGMRGVILIDVKAGTPADRLGFQKGDVVVSINRVPVKTSKEMAEITSQNARAWEIIISRDGREFLTVLR